MNSLSTFAEQKNTSDQETRNYKSLSSGIIVLNRLAETSFK